MATTDELRPLRFLGLEFRLERRRDRPTYHAYLFATFISLVCALLSWGLHSWFGVSNGFLVFLLGVAVTAVIYGTGPSIWASCVSTALLAYFFMPPIFSFAVSDIQHIFTLLVMATIGVVISTLATQVIHQTEAAQRNANRFEALYRLSRELADLAGSEHLARAAVKHIQSVVGGTATVLFPDPRRDFRPVPAAPLATGFRAREWVAARAAFDAREPVGLGTHTMPGVLAKFLPLKLAHEPLGVLAAQPPEGCHDFTDEQTQMLEMLTAQLTGALERDRLSHRVQTVQSEVESERMRAALLSSVSHDLRTPLAVVAGASSSMLDDTVQLTPEARRRLCGTIYDNANRLARIVDNLLNMTRIESGIFKVSKQAHVLEEVVGSTLRNLSDHRRASNVQVRLPADLPLVPMDDVLFQQVLFNLLDNAQKYSPADSVVELAAAVEADRLLVEVADRGAGLRIGDEQRVFEKFYRGPGEAQRTPGSGLGLTICRAIIAAHGGTIVAENRPGGGAVFRLWLPLYAPTSDHFSAAERLTTATSVLESPS